MEQLCRAYSNRVVELVVELAFQFREVLLSYFDFVEVDELSRNDIPTCWLNAPDFEPYSIESRVFSVAIVLTPDEVNCFHVMAPKCSVVYRGLRGLSPFQFAAEGFFELLELLFYFNDFFARESVRVHFLLQIVLLANL